MFETPRPQRTGWPPPEGDGHPSFSAVESRQFTVAKPKPKGKEKKKGHKNGRINLLDDDKAWNELLRATHGPMARAGAANRHGAITIPWLLTSTKRPQSLRVLSRAKREDSTKLDFLRLVSPGPRWSTVHGCRTKNVKLNGKHVEITLEVPIAMWCGAGGDRIDQALGRTDDVLDKSQRAFLIRCGNRIVFLGELRARDRQRLDAIVELVNSTGQAKRGVYRARKGNGRQPRAKKHNWAPVGWTLFEGDADRPSHGNMHDTIEAQQLQHQRDKEEREQRLRWPGKICKRWGAI